MKNVYLFIYDGFADSDVAHLLTSITKSNCYSVKTIAMDKTPKQSLSGLSVIPDLDFFPQVDLHDIDETNTALLILPGGAAWEDKINFAIIPLVMHCIMSGIAVAASAEATLLLADLGLLNILPHTSMNQNYLNTFSAIYQGTDCFINSGTVHNKGIITTSGRDPADFSNVVLKLLNIQTHFNEFQYQELLFE